MRRVLVIGAGLSGLFASYLAAVRGATVANLSAGRGGLELSHGCIDIWRRDPPMPSALRAAAGHPYSRLGDDDLREAMDVLARLLHDQGLPYQGDLRRNMTLPTAGGAAHITALAPFTLAAGDMADPTPMCFAQLVGFRDFYPSLSLRAVQHTAINGSVIDLPLPDLPSRRDLYATDIAHLFERPEWRLTVVTQWKPRIVGVRRLGLPAVLGLQQHSEVVADLHDRLGLQIFEVPTLPPSLPGLRLERALRRACLDQHVAFIDGGSVIGRVDGRVGGGRASGVVAMSAGGPRAYPADVVILASGGILNGGLVAMADGRVRETVFDMPVHAPLDRGLWTAASPFEEQAYEGFGLVTDECQRPLGADGRALFENVYAVGGLLAGAHPTAEGSRQGIDVATAHHAIGAALG